MEQSQSPQSEEQGIVRLETGIAGFPSAQISSLRNFSSSSPGYRSPIPGRSSSGKSHKSVSQTSRASSASARLRFYDWNILACINCAFSSAEEISAIQPKGAQSEKLGSAPKQGPLFLELRRLVCDLSSVSTSPTPSLFSSTSLCEARGNPSLGSSVSSTCLSVTKSNIARELPVVATGLSTGVLCIHNFSGGDTWKASTEYYHVPRVQRPATAVEWRVGHNQQVAIGLTAGGGPSELRQQAQQGLRLAGKVAPHPGDRDYCCFLWDIEHQSSNLRTKSTPINRLSHQVGIASLGWVSEGSQVLALGTQHRNLQIHDIRMQGTAPLSVYAHNFGVHGVRSDPIRPWQFATFSRAAGETIKLWDIRKIDSAAPTELKLQSPTSTSPIVDVIKWSPTGDLSVVAGDGYMYLFETKGARPLCTNVLHTNGLVDDFAYFPGVPSEVGLQPTSKPFRELSSKRLLVVRRDQHIDDIPLCRAAPIAISHNTGHVVHACGKAIASHVNVDHLGVGGVEDISRTIMRRTGTSKASPRYCMDVHTNIEILKREIKAMEEKMQHQSIQELKSRELLRSWKWIQRVELLAEHWTIDGRENHSTKSLLGVGAINMLGSQKDESESKTFSEAVRCDVYGGDPRRYDTNAQVDSQNSHIIVLFQGSTNLLWLGRRA